MNMMGLNGLLKRTARGVDMSYSVGKEDSTTVLTIGSKDDGISTTLTMDEVAVIQLVKLLAATLQNFTIDIKRVD